MTGVVVGEEPTLGCLAENSDRATEGWRGGVVEGEEGRGSRALKGAVKDDIELEEDA